MICKGGFPGGSVVKNLPAMQETWVQSLGSIPRSGRSPGEGNGSPLQYSCLGNPMDREAWQATVSPWGHKESEHNSVTKQQEFSTKKNFLRTSCFLKDIKSPFNFWSQYPFGWMPDNQDFTILCYLNSHFSVNTFNGKQFVLCINNETTKEKIENHT